MCGSNHYCTSFLTVSIARRLQDPLAELVKIEPKHIGVGMYQVKHTMSIFHVPINKTLPQNINHHASLGTCAIFMIMTYKVKLFFFFFIDISPGSVRYFKMIGISRKYDRNLIYLLKKICSLISCIEDGIFVYYSLIHMCMNWIDVVIHVSRYLINQFIHFLIYKNL